MTIKSAVLPFSDSACEALRRAVAISLEEGIEEGVAGMLRSEATGDLTDVPLVWRGKTRMAVSVEEFSDPFRLRCDFDGVVRELEVVERE